ncbi:MAG: insulinase family protein, partial [Marinilabiliales bacterium]
GDIDVDEMEKKIIAQFGSIKNPENAPERKLYEIPNNDEPLISIETDPEATQNMAMFFYKHPKKEMSTIEDYRQSLVEGLYNGMLNARLNELSQKPECPYIFAQTSYGQFLARNLDAYTSYGMMKENQIDKGIEAIMTENQRVKQHGFNATELERMKKDMLQRYEKAAKEADKTPSKRLADQYVSNYLTQEPIPSVKTEFKLAQKLVPEIKLEEINKLANEWITDNNFVMMVTAPEKEGVEVPTKEDILNIIEKVKKVKLEPYIDDVSDAPLLKDMPVGSKVTATKENEELGFTELTLGNGIRVVLMPTDFKNDEILMSAYSYGGTSHASDEDILDATFSFAIVQQCGVGEFSSTQLEKKLQGKDVEVMPVITDTDEGFRGSCAPKDLETMLQLTFLYCTNPRVDKEAFDSFISKMKNQMKFLGSSPMMVFQDTLTKVMSSNSPRAIAVPKTEQLDKIDMNKAFEFYNDRYSDAGDFNFFFVGNFDVEELKPLLEKYLGGLPSKNRKESYLDKSPKFPEGIKDVTVHKGMDEKSIVAIVMDGEFDYNYTSKLHIKVMTQILNIKLREYLREEESGVYGVQIMEQISQYPKPRYKLIVYFPCSPKNAKKLTKTVFREMEKIMAEGPTDDDLAKVKETLTREHEENLKENKYWLRTLEGKYFNNESFDNFNKYTEDIKAITKEEIQQAAKKYITPEHYVRVVLMPEKK